MKYLLFVLVILLNSCITDNNAGKGLKLINNSSSDVYFYTSLHLNTGHFPDTILPMNRPETLQFIPANGSSGKFVDPDWVGIFSSLPEDKYSMYIFSVDVIDNIDWDIVRDDYLVLKRIDMTLEELIASDYIFEYQE